VSYLIDTNVVSELRKRAPNRNVVEWYESVASSAIYLSALTIGEIRMGVERVRRKDPQHADTLATWLHGLHATYGDRIVDVDAAIAEEWGCLNIPDPLPTIDGLLAATAMTRGWVLVTRNVADLHRCGVRLLNPFDPAGR
jgi:toxin FitB